MPGEVKHKSGSFSQSFCKAAMAMTDGQSKEYLWGCSLSKEKPSVTWTFEEEDDDEDFLHHTLFLRHAVLGAEVVKEERNIVEVETKGSNGETIKIPMISLLKGQSEMATLDMNFSHEVPVTFRLLHGNGPIHLTAQELVEFPQEEDDETELEYTEDDATATEEEEEEETGKLKRKASKQKKGKSKKGKLDSSAASDENGTEEDDEEDEEESMEDDEEDEEEDSEEEEDTEEDEKPKKKAVKGKGKGVKVAKKAKTTPKGAKKAGKKAKAK